MTLTYRPVVEDKPWFVAVIQEVPVVCARIIAAYPPELFQSQAIIMTISMKAYILQL